jgi:hypothetical protein
MAAPASVAAAPPAFPSTTSTKLDLRSMQRNGSSYAELGLGHGDEKRAQGKLRLRRRCHPHKSRLGDRKWAAPSSPFVAFCANTGGEGSAVAPHLVPWFTSAAHITSPHYPTRNSVWMSPRLRRWKQPNAMDQSGCLGALSQGRGILYNVIKVSARYSRRFAPSPGQTVLCSMTH